MSTRSDGDMSWFGWGDPSAVEMLPRSTRDLIATALGAELCDIPPVAEEDVRLPAPNLGEWAAADLHAAVGAEHVRTDAATRLRHTGGKSTPDLLRRRAGDAERAPDAVVLPADHDDVLAVLATCARHRVAVVPFGGGTSVVGGVEPLRGGLDSLIALDLRRLDRMTGFDAESRTATLQAGVRTPRAEELLAAHDHTLGHLPQSYEYATIGGYAATRSTGQASAGYGRFDDMVTALRVATPRGGLDLGRAPASAAGPDLRQVMLGSEGVFGVITEATLRVHPLPEARLDAAWSFPDFATGAAALRRLARSPATPAFARLSDETETFVNAALAGRETALAPGCLLVAGFEGTEDDAAHRCATASRLLTEEGAVSLGEEPVAEWRRSRFHAPYLRDALLSAGVLSETLETAATWSAVLRLHDAVRAAAVGALGTREGDNGADTGVVVMAHISHTYSTGASLYFTVVTAAGAEPLRRWDAAKRAAVEVITTHGGTITHHHGVGADHRPWMTAEIGPLGADILRAVKTSVDPQGVLNPGKLIPDAGHAGR